MNIILVVFDSLRKDCIGRHGPAPWGEVATPNLDAFAEDALVMARAYPEALPTIPARRALYTGKRVFPFVNGDYRLKGDFVGAPGWGPIPESQDTLAELLQARGYRTALVSDLYHMFKPSKNFWRGFDQWLFLRGQETDRYRSGPAPSRQQIDAWLPWELQTPDRIAFIRQCLMNMHDRVREDDYFNARVFREAARWLEQNRDADKFFLVVECFDPHEPWFVPEYYRRMYDETDGPEQVISGYADTGTLGPGLLRRTQANYSGLVTMCDRWFGHFFESIEVLGLLDETIVIITADHGHSVGDRGYMGKRGYPSMPEVFDVPLMIRHPYGIGAGLSSDVFVQPIDVAAQILAFAGAAPNSPLDGVPFWAAATSDTDPIRDYVTAAWGTAVTVVDRNWWLNSKVNGKGVFLRDLSGERPFDTNVASDYPDVVRALFARALADAGGTFPGYLVALADREADAPGCSELAART